MFINLCFHRITDTESETRTIYELTIKKFWQLKNCIDDYLSKSNDTNLNVRYYFDDGDVSIFNIIYKKTDLVFNNKIVCAIPTNYINKENKLSNDQIIELHNNGIVISSHGTSHAALAIYKNDILQQTPSDGKYEDAPYGKGKILTENEVLYQLKVSKNILENLVGDVEEFVLPYCLYNDNTISINSSNNIYSTITHCIDNIDVGQFLRPRFLIDNSATPENLIQRIDAAVKRS